MGFDPYEPERDGAITARYKPNQDGSVTKITYDEQGRIVSSEHISRERLRREYPEIDRQNHYDHSMRTAPAPSIRH